MFEINLLLNRFGLLYWPDVGATHMIEYGNLLVLNEMNGHGLVIQAAYSTGNWKYSLHT